MRIDLHVHSNASRRPSIWLLQKIGCAESYTEPEELYGILKSRGMDAFTITDHNTIEGALKIAHLPGAFVSSEITTYFPEDRCKLHVLVYRIDEPQFMEIDRLRENVYDLVPYLIEKGIDHSLAHPFFSINGRLAPEHFDKCLLLFRNFEMNGDDEPATNAILKEIIDFLDRDEIERLADRYDMEPLYEKAWKKGITGGSDDHSSLYAARAFTQVEMAEDIDEFFKGIRNGTSTAIYRQTASPEVMAHHIYSVAYQFFRRRFPMSSAVGGSTLMRFLDRVLVNQHTEDTPSGRFKRKIAAIKSRIGNQKSKKASIIKKLQTEAQQLISDDDDLASVIIQPHPFVQEPADKWFNFTRKVSNKVLSDLSGEAIDHLFGINLMDIFHGIGSTGTLYTLLSPYFIAYTVFNDTRSFAKRVQNTYARRPAGPKGANVALLTDTFDEINGVSLTLRRQAALSQQMGKRLNIMTCSYDGEHELDLPNVKYFDPISMHDCPEYPEQKIFVPSLLELLRYCYRRDLTHVQASTPGPMGLAGLAISRIMKLPLYTTYHTSVPQYTLHLTEDSGMEDLMWRFILWFYNQSDKVFAPSRFTANELIDRGVPEEKVALMPRGVDLEHFRRDPGIRDKALPDGKKLLYVGRVSVEKNLPLLCEVFRKLIDMGDEAHLVIVGDGPYLEEMKKELCGYPCTFTGYKTGEELVSIYNACDLFVFPSTTDTFGNVVLESYACGLPVVGMETGGQLENIEDGVTGFIARDNSRAAFLNAVKALLNDDELREKMSRNARAAVEDRTFEWAFEEYWKHYELGLTVKDNGLSPEEPLGDRPEPILT